MCRKVDELAGTLTPDERGALEALERERAGRGLPFAQVERLMNLGLAEVSQGGLDLTVAGRLALGSLRAG